VGKFICGKIIVLRYIDILRKAYDLYLKILFPKDFRIFLPSF